MQEDDRYPYRGRGTDPLPPDLDTHPLPREGQGKPEAKPSNDLQVLESLKDRIKRGQHEIYRPIPQPSLLASLYLGSSPIVSDDSPLKITPPPVPLGSDRHSNEPVRNVSKSSNNAQKGSYPVCVFSCVVDVYITKSPQPDDPAAAVRVKVEEEMPTFTEAAYRRYEDKRPVPRPNDRHGNIDTAMLPPDRNSPQRMTRAPAARGNEADRNTRGVRRDSNAHPYPRDGRHSFSHQREGRQEDFRHDAEPYADRLGPPTPRSAVFDIPPSSVGYESHLARQHAMPPKSSADYPPSGRDRALSPTSERDRLAWAGEYGQRSEETHIPPHLGDNRSLTGDHTRGSARRTSVIRGGPPSPNALEARLANDRQSPPLSARSRIPLGERISDRAAPPSLQDRLRSDVPARKNSALSLEERLSSPTESRNHPRTGGGGAGVGDRRPVDQRTGVPGDRYVPSPDHVAAAATARLPLDAPRRSDPPREPPYDGRDRYIESSRYGDSRRDFSPPPPVVSGLNGRTSRGRSPPHARTFPSPPPLPPRRESPPPRLYRDPYAPERAAPYRPNSDYDTVPVDRYWQGPPPSEYPDEHHLWSRASERRTARSRSPPYYTAPVREPYGRASPPPHSATLTGRSSSPMRGMSRMRDDGRGYYVGPSVYERQRSPIGDSYPPAGYARPRYDPRDDRGRYMPPPPR